MPNFKYDPTVNLGHLISAGMMLVTGAVAYGTLEKRVSVQEERAQASVMLASERADATKDALKEIKTDIKDLGRNMNALASVASQTAANNASSAEQKRRP